ncbi:hypothetical protein TNCT_557741 [Trichonephila clavata]|uniref:Uncharacterized protein n=1 Tax=Trichonephila clavata TaxID=2740835 RepID=A0A8X6GFT3_TRICU|nr:hypothetical protein TNCT_557741 [Trichonephila clavata]
MLNMLVLLKYRYIVPRSRINKQGTTKREQEMIPQEIRPDAPNDVEFDYPCQSLLDRRSLAVNEALRHGGE